MGAQTSKVARKLPTKPRPETLQNIPKESPSTLEPTVNTIVSETKSEVIEQDGSDPHLLENLKALGPVTIPPTVTKMRTTDKMLGIIQERNRANELFDITDKSVTIDSLFSLFEQRKRLQPGELNKPDIRSAMMEQYNLDEKTLDTLLKTYNTMAVMPPSADDKEERRRGIWVNDKVDWEKNVKAVEERNAQIKKQKEEARKDNNRTTGTEEEKDRALKDLFEENY